MNRNGFVGRATLPATLAVAILGATGFMLVSHARAEGERELRTAESFAAAGKTDQAISHARRAAGWNVPYSPHVPAAYDKLIALARGSEARGDPAVALSAWRAVRHAALSSRWFAVSHEEHLYQADTAIARLSARQTAFAGIAAPPQDELQNTLADSLAREIHPHAAWAALMVAGFFALCTGLAQAVLRGAGGPTGYTWPKVRIGAALAAAGAAAWAAGIWFA